MLENTEHWNVISKFIIKIVKVKEEEEWPRQNMEKGKYPDPERCDFKLSFFFCRSSQKRRELARICQPMTALKRS